MDVLAHAREVKHTADHLLAQSHILDTLAAYGTPQLLGSYALDIMYGPDIDLVLVTDQPKQVSRRVLSTLLEQDYFQRYEYGDFVRFPYANRPTGYILVLALTIGGVYWELETWFVAEPMRETERLMAFVRQQLTPPTRTAILELKHQRHLHGSDKHRLSSVDIYYGVLRHGARTWDDLLTSNRMDT